MGVGELDVVTMGETLACLTARSGRLPTVRQLDKSIGGTESNTAIGLARLGHGVAWISKVGDDPFGDEIVRTLRGEGVDVSAVQRSADAPTGLMVKECRSPNDIHVYYYRRGSAAAQLTDDDVPEDLLAGTRRLHLSGITLALGDGPTAAVDRAVSICSRRGVPISFDPNFRRKLWKDSEAVAAYERIYPYVDDLLITESELLACADVDALDDAMAYLERFEIQRVAIRRGARGVVGLAGGARTELAAAPVAHVVDTVGAGDAFNAGYLHGLLTGCSFEQALGAGTWVAGRVVSHLGDYEGLPTLDEYIANGDGRRPTLR